MRILLIGLLFIATAVAGQGQYVYHSEAEKTLLTGFIENHQSDPVALQLVVDQSVDEAKLRAQDATLQNWVRSFEEKRPRFKDERSFVTHLFYKVHRKVLKNYTQFSSFNETLQNGNYDCLTGTILYAALLKQLNIAFEVVETNYHLYMIVYPKDGGTILLESTDPLYGLVVDPVQITKRIEAYNYDQETTEEGQYSFQVKINHKVDEFSMVGLQYYNAAVDQFNQGNLDSSVKLFEKATIFYQSSRLEEFGYVLAQAIMAADKESVPDQKALLKRIPVGNEGVVAAF